MHIPSMLNYNQKNFLLFLKDNAIISSQIVLCGVFGIEAYKKIRPEIIFKTKKGFFSCSKYGFKKMVFEQW